METAGKLGLRPLKKEGGNTGSHHKQAPHEKASLVDQVIPFNKIPYNSQSALKKKTGTPVNQRTRTT